MSCFVTFPCKTKNSGFSHFNHVCNALYSLYLSKYGWENILDCEISSRNHVYIRNECVLFCYQIPKSCLFSLFFRQIRMKTRYVSIKPNVIEGVLWDFHPFLNILGSITLKNSMSCFVTFMVVIL